MTDHRAEAVRLLALADATYLDDSDEPGDRDQYPSEDEWLDAMEYSNQVHERNIAEAQMLAQMATAHALLAQLPATVEDQAVEETDEDGPDFYAQEFPYPGGHTEPCPYIAGISSTCACGPAEG